MKKLITLGFFVSFLWGCSNIFLNYKEPLFKINGDISKSPKITPFYDKYWLLLEDLTFTFYRENQNTRYKIIVPVGFVTDLASIPVGVNVIFDHYGRYASAGIIHDYLYWIQPCSRKFSDRIYRDALKAYGVPLKDRYIMWEGLKVGGSKAWENNQKARKSGETRYIPEAFRNQITPNIRWNEYRDKNNFIQANWEKIVSNPSKPSYCNIIGDADEKS